jgi:hypothetical protein
MIKRTLIRRKDGSVEELSGVDTVEVWFGPHFVIRVEGEGFVSLLATHHGVRLGATEVGGELEQGLAAMGQAFPGAQFDSWPSLTSDQ